MSIFTSQVSMMSFKASRFFLDRYIDEIVSILRRSDLYKFKSIANQYHDNINVVPACVGRVSVPFLDLAFSVVARRIEWDLYPKPQNQYQYLPRSSCHHRTTLQVLSSVKTLGYIVVACTVTEFANRLRLLKRGYSNQEIDKCFDVASKRVARPRRTSSSSFKHVRKVFSRQLLAVVRTRELCPDCLAGTVIFCLLKLSCHARRRKMG